MSRRILPLLNAAVRRLTAAGRTSLEAYAQSRPVIAELAATHDVVVLDRYVASNAAYSAARLHQGADGDVVAWVRQLEFERLALPVPDWQLYLNVPTELAAERAARREAQDASRTRDAYERDGGLQGRTGAVYAALAAENWVGRWALVAPDVDPAELATKLLS